MKRFYIFIYLFLSGCMVGPNYQPPPNEVPDTWVSLNQIENNSFATDEPLDAWWEQFNDPLLTKYIHMASNYNNTLLTAEANILEARAIRQVTASSLVPQIFADFNATRTQFSKNGPIFEAGTPAGGTGPLFTAQIPQIQNLYNATIDAIWELDLFGKTRRSIESAEAQIGSAIEGRNDILITLYAEVARNYIEVRSAQQRLDLTNKNIELLEIDKNIIEQRYEFGLAPKFDYESIEAELLSTLSTKPEIEVEIYRGIFALATLIGSLPECIINEMLPDKPLPKLPEEVLVGLRSDLLRRRPDVRQAERQLAAATANIGVAVANFFPSVTLSGNVGFQSLSLSNLFTGNSSTWAYGADINIPIFQGGALVGNLKLAEARTAAAAYTYQQVVLTAIQEAETAIVAYSKEVETSKLLKDTSLKRGEVAVIAKKRYSGGLTGITDFINIEREYISAQQNLVKSQRDALIELIALYKTLGGSPYNCIIP